MIPKEVESYYLTEACAYFALALNELFGHDIFVLESENEDGELVVAHVFTMKNNIAIDVKGARPVAEIKNQYYDLEYPRLRRVVPADLVADYMGDDKPLYGYSQSEVDEAKEYIVKNRHLYE